MSKPTGVQPSHHPTKEIPLADVAITFDAHDYFQPSNEPESVTVAGKDIGPILRYAFGVGRNLEYFARENVDTVTAELRGVADMLRALSDLDGEGHSVITIEHVLYALSKQLHHLAARLEAETYPPAKAMIQLSASQAANGTR